MRLYPAPRFHTWLLTRLLPPSHREAVLGDLTEEFAIHADPKSRLSAARWYRGQVYRSIPLLLWSDVRRGRSWSTLGVAFAAFIAAGMLESVGLAAISRFWGSDTHPHAGINAFVGLVTIALGGYVAAWIRQGAAVALAGMEIVVVAMLMATMNGSAPLWYGLTFLVIGPLAALAGGTLSPAKADRQGRLSR